MQKQWKKTHKERKQKKKEKKNQKKKKKKKKKRRWSSAQDPGRARSRPATQAAVGARPRSRRDRKSVV